MARRSFFAYKRALSPTGTFVMVGGPMQTVFQTLILGKGLSKRGGQQLGLLMHKPNKDLALLVELFAAGKVMPVIGRCYPLSEAAVAFQTLSAGEAQGKLVITVIS